MQQMTGATQHLEITAAAARRCAIEHNLRIGMFAQAQKRIGFVIAKDDIIFRFERFDKIVFQNQRFVGGGGDGDFQMLRCAGHLLHARRLFGAKVRFHAAFYILRFADIERAPVAVKKAIDPRRGGQVIQCGANVKLAGHCAILPARRAQWDILAKKRLECGLGSGKKRSNMQDDKNKALRAALEKIEKAYGRGSVMRLGDFVAGQKEVAAISTGSLGLDIALGIGGLPRGRVVEIYGPESSGKTTIALQVIASAQKAGGLAAFIDAEHALDTTYAQKLGVNVDDLLLSQPDDGEQALEITDTLVRSGSIDVLVIDSVAALTPRAELEGEMGASLPGLQARLMSQALRKLTASINQAGTMVLFINQLRMKIGVMFGSPETTTGGNALKFYSSVRLDIRRIGAIKKGEEIIGNETRVKVVKNKIAPPFRKAEFEIYYGKGVSLEGELLDIGVQHDLVQKSGSWYAINGARIGQGKENSRQWLLENPKPKKNCTAR